MKGVIKTRTLIKKITVMKRFSIYLSLLAFILILTGCPDSTSVPLAKKGTIKIDKAFYGEWETDILEDDLERFIVSPNDAYSYKIKATIWDMTDTYEEDFIAWFVVVDNYKFVVAQQIEDGSLKDVYYLYSYSLEKNELKLRILTDAENIHKKITSPETYMKELKTAMKTNNFLSDPIIYTKTQ